MPRPEGIYYDHPLDKKFNHRIKVINWYGWKSRESDRFYGEYIQPIWENESFCNSFPKNGGYTYHFNMNHHYRFTHVCLKNPRLVSYTQSDDKGSRDIQTPLKVGRYLTKFYPHLTKKEIAYWVAKHIEKFCSYKDSLLLATTPDKIIEVYKNGPQSCMKGMDCVKVYGAGDLAIAYIEKDDRITARCVVWPDKKIYNRIFGDADTLSPTLALNGYTKGDIEGARLLKIAEGSQFIMPYIDNQDEITIGKDFLYIGSISDKNHDGECKCSNTDGFSGLENSCDNCNEGIEDDDCYSLNGETYCESCYDVRTFYCESCQESCENDDFGAKVNDDSVCDSCLSNHTSYCGTCEEHHYHDDITKETLEGESICDNCAECEITSSCGDFVLFNGDTCECTHCENEREEEEREEREAEEEEKEEEQAKNKAVAA